MEFVSLLQFGALVVIAALVLGLLYFVAMGVFTLNKIWHLMEDNAKSIGKTGGS